MYHALTLNLSWHCVIRAIEKVQINIILKERDGSK